MSENELLFKIIVVGDIAVGKTSLIKRYVHNIFTENYKSTIGVDFALKVLNIDNKNVRIQLWDIAGQERFGNMTRVYYKEAVGAVVVYDVTRESTLTSATKWKTDIDTKLTIPGSDLPIPCILIGNKIDILPKSNPTLNETMDTYCKDEGYAAWFRTSAKTNIGIEPAIKHLVSLVLKSNTITTPRTANVVNLLETGYTEDETCRC